MVNVPGQFPKVDSTPRLAQYPYQVVMQKVPIFIGMIYQYNLVINNIDKGSFQGKYKVIWVYSVPSPEDLTITFR